MHFESLEESLRCMAILIVLIIFALFMDMAHSYRDIKKGRENKEDHIGMAYWLAKRVYENKQ